MKTLAETKHSKLTCPLLTIPFPVGFNSDVRVFSLERFKCFLVERKCGQLYRGIAVNGENITFHEDLPNGGKDIQDTPVFWTLPGGMTVEKSMREIIEMPENEVLYNKGRTNEEYHNVAKEMGYWCIGAVADKDLEEFKADPGTLKDEKFRNIPAVMPLNDMAPCWWAVTRGDLDKPAPLLCHSLMQLQLELQHHRLATPGKLSNEWMRRCDHNAEALDALEDYPELWQDGCYLFIVSHAISCVGFDRVTKSERHMMF